MTAKRKTYKPTPAIPQADAAWDIIDFLKSDPRYREIAEEIFSSKEVSKEEKLQSEIGDFLDSLDGPRFESEDAVEFEKRWRQFLSLSIALARRQLFQAGTPKEKVNRLIVPGWAFFDARSANICFRFGPPLDGSNAVLVILVFRDAVWHPPTHVEAAVWRHPDLRPSVGNDEPLGWKDRVMQRLTWAAALDDQGVSSQRLRELSGAITSLFHVSSYPDPEDAWIPSAVKSQRFWAILAHAIDFGMHQNARRLFMNGKLLGAAEDSALHDKIKMLSWFLIIEEAIREILAETESVPTPSELRKRFGVKDSPGSDQVVLEFSDPRFKQHGVITWGMFKKYAKQAGKIGSSHRTQS